jgi:hypothetical protein
MAGISRTLESGPNFITIRITGAQTKIVTFMVMGYALFIIGGLSLLAVNRIALLPSGIPSKATLAAFPPHTVRMNCYVSTPGS